MTNKLLTACQGSIAGLLEAEANAPRDVLLATCNHEANTDWYEMALALIRPMLEYLRTEVDRLKVSVETSTIAHGAQYAEGLLGYDIHRIARVLATVDPQIAAMLEDE